MSIVESELNKRHVTWGEPGECGKAVRAQSQFSVINILNATSTRLFSKGSWHISEEDFSSPYLLLFFEFLSIYVYTHTHTHMFTLMYTKYIRKLTVFLSLQMVRAVRCCPFRNTASSSYMSCTAPRIVWELLTKSLLIWTTCNKFEDTSFLSWCISDEWNAVFTQLVSLYYICWLQVWADNSKDAFKMFASVVILPHVWSVKVIDLSVRQQISSL